MAGVKSIVGCCIRTGTVKKLIYTASVVAASPLKEEEDGRTSFKESMDESCWTPLNLSYSFTNDMLMVCYFHPLSPSPYIRPQFIYTHSQALKWTACLHIRLSMIDIYNSHCISSKKLS